MTNVYSFNGGNKCAEAEAAAAVTRNQRSTLEFNSVWPNMPTTIRAPNGKNANKRHTVAMTSMNLCESSQHGNLGIASFVCCLALSILKIYIYRLISLSRPLELAVGTHTLSHTLTTCWNPFGNCHTAAAADIGATNLELHSQHID